MEPPGEPENVDVVFSRHVIHMLTHPRRALANWFGLLRPGRLSSSAERPMERSTGRLRLSPVAV